MKTFIIAVLTADGFIARSTDHPSSDWASKEDREFFQERTAQAKLMIMGLNTYNARKHPLPGQDRRRIVYAEPGTAVPDAEVTQEAPNILLRRMEQAGYEEAAIVGGSQIYTMFMEAGLVQKLYLSIEPIVFGSGIRLFTKPLDVRLILDDMRKLSDKTVLLEYSVIS